jgi:hypothetical protein
MALYVYNHVISCISSHLPGIATAATDPIARRKRSNSTSATHRATTNVPSATSTVIHGTTCSAIVAIPGVELCVWDAIMARARIGRQTVMSIGSMWTTSMFVENVSDISVRRAICIRYVIRLCRRHAFADSMKHRLSHRQPRYECYRCTSKFKTYGGMVSLFLFLKSSTHISRSSTSNTAAVVTSIARTSTSLPPNAAKGATSSTRTPSSAQPAMQSYRSYLVCSSTLSLRHVCRRWMVVLLDS